MERSFCFMNKDESFYREKFEQGKISHWELESSLKRLKDRNYKKEEKYKNKQTEQKLRKRRQERDCIDEYLAELERQYAEIKPVRRTIMSSVLQLVYENNIKKYGQLTCYLCNQPVKFGQDAVDHKIPVSRGGSNNLENLEIAHSRCNSIKHSKTVTEYEDYRNKRAEQNKGL